MKPEYAVIGKELTGSRSARVLVFAAVAAVVTCSPALRHRSPVTTPGSASWDAAQRDLITRMTPANGPRFQAKLRADGRVYLAGLQLAPNCPDADEITDSTALRLATCVVSRYGTLFGLNSK